MEDLSKQLSNSGAGIRLVVLGDMLDLTRLDGRVPRVGAVAASIQRLESIADAHAELFHALGRFVSAGGELDYVVGNHDLDLANPAVQERFIGLLRMGPLGPGTMGVTFHRWFLHVGDVVYAEHGHRYHDINVVPVPDGREVPSVHTPENMPLVAYMDSYLQTLRARVSARTLANDLGALTRALVARKARQTSLLMARTSPGYYARLRDAADPGLDVDALIAIDALSAHLGPKTAVRVARTIFGAPLRLILPYGAATALLRLVLRDTPLRGATIALAWAAALATLVRHRGRVWPPARSTGYAVDAAQHLRLALDSAGLAVPFYVLGHTHVPTLEALDGAGRPATYINTGSWTVADRLGRGYPFVRITRIETGDPDAELLWWQPRTSRDHAVG